MGGNISYYNHDEIIDYYGINTSLINKYVYKYINGKYIIRNQKKMIDEYLDNNCLGYFINLLMQIIKE